MLKLTELNLVNWCQHKKLNLVFSPGTNGIVGANGKGKSNALAAAFTAITGRVTNGNIEDAIGYGSDSTEISLDYIQDGTAGRVTRKFTAKQTDTPGVREKSKSTAKLTFGDIAPITGSQKVTEHMTSITGLEPGIIENHIFISQDKVVSLLFQTKSERLKSFLSLIDEVRLAEPTRAAILAELERYPLVEVAADIDQLLQQQAVLQGELAEAMTSHSAVKLALDASNVDSPNAIITKYDAGRLALAQKIAAEKTIAQYTIRLNDCTVKLAEADTTIAAMCDYMDHARPAVAAATAELSQVAQTTTIIDARKRAQAELDQLVTAIEAQTAPSDDGRPWEALPELTAQHTACSAQVVEDKRVLAVLKQGGTCPTCGNVFTDVKEREDTIVKRLAVSEPQLQSLNGQIARLRAAENVYAKAKAAHDMWVDQTVTRMTSLQATLVELPELTAPDAGKLAAFKEMIVQFNIQTAAHDNAVREVNTIRTELASTQARIDATQAAAEASDAQIAVMPSDMEYMAAVQARDAYITMSAEAGRLRGVIGAKQQELTRLATALTATKQAQARSTSIREYRQLLTVVRDTLHREKLPQEVLFSYIGELDVLCNKFLSLFGNPFAIAIERDMDMRCIMPNGYITTADRLSGGQKCVLAVAMRFAINELFAKDLGLLILDEPTAWMDEDNIECMGELISQVHQISKESGVQTIIITHAKELIPSFEHVIQIG